MQHCLCELIETEIEYSKSPWPPLIRGRCWYAAPPDQQSRHRRV